MNIVSRVNIVLRRFLHNHGNIATEGSPKSGLYLTLIEWCQGFFIVHSTIDNTVHSRPLNSLEHYMHNLDDTNPTLPRFEPGTSEFRATTGPNEPSEPAIIILPATCISWRMCFDKTINWWEHDTIKALLTVYILTALTYFLFPNFICTFLFAARIGHTQQQQSSIGGSCSSHYYPTNLNSLGHGICVH